MEKIKKIVYIVILTFFFSLNTLWIWVDETPVGEIDQQSIIIQKRFYHIQRLKNAYEYILEQKNAFTQEKLTFLSEKINHLQDQSIKKYINLFISSHDIRAIQILWKKLNGFHSLDSTDFIIEFSYVFYYMLVSLGGDVYKEKKIIQSPINLEDLFDQIDNLYVLFKNKNIHIKEEGSDIFIAGTIACRFYVIQRLNKSINLLKAYYQRHRISKKKIFFRDCSFIAFKSAVIESLYFSLIKNGTIKPIFTFYTQFENFKYVRDILLTKEFLKLYFLLFYDISQAFTIKDVASGAIDFLSILLRIDELSILELLESIDLIVFYYESLRERPISFFGSLCSWVGLYDD